MFVKVVGAVNRVKIALQVSSVIFLLSLSYEVLFKFLLVRVVSHEGFSVKLFL